MRFTVNQKEFAHRLGQVGKTLPGRPLQPILRGIRVVAGDSVSLSVFNGDVFSKSGLAGDVAEQGEVIVPGKPLVEIVRKFPAGDVECSIRDGMFRIVHGKTAVTLPLLNGDEYPSVPKAPNNLVKYETAEFVDAVTGVGLAASRDETIPALGGIRVECSGGVLSFAATDRFRLHAGHVVVDGPDVEALIPAKPFLDSIKNVENGAFRMGVGDNVASIHDGESVTIIPLSGAEFPNWRRLLDQSQDKSIEVDVHEMLSAVKRAGTFSGTAKRVVLTVVEDGIQISSSDSESGGFSDFVPGAVVGDLVGFEFAVNDLYFSDALNAVGDSRAVIRISGASRPVLVVPVSGGVECLVMPVRM